MHWRIITINLNSTLHIHNIALWHVWAEMRSMREIVPNLSNLQQSKSNQNQIFHTWIKFICICVLFSHHIVFFGSFIYLFYNQLSNKLVCSLDSHTVYECTQTHTLLRCLFFFRIIGLRALINVGGMSPENNQDRWNIQCMLFCFFPSLSQATWYCGDGILDSLELFKIFDGKYVMSLNTSDGLPVRH